MDGHEALIVHLLGHCLLRGEHNRSRGISLGTISAARLCLLASVCAHATATQVTAAERKPLVQSVGDAQGQPARPDTALTRIRRAFQARHAASWSALHIQTRKSWFHLPTAPRGSAGACIFARASAAPCFKTRTQLTALPGRMGAAPGTQHAARSRLWRWQISRSQPSRHAPSIGTALRQSSHAATAAA